LLKSQCIEMSDNYSNWLKRLHLDDDIEKLLRNWRGKKARKSDVRALAF